MSELLRQTINAAERAAAGEDSPVQDYLDQLLRDPADLHSFGDDERVYLAVLLDSIGLHGESIRILQDSLIPVPGSAAAFFQNTEGMLAAAHGQHDRARRVLRGALSAASDDLLLRAKILANLTAVSLHAGSVEEAEAWADAYCLGAEAGTPATDVLIASVRAGIASARGDVPGLRTAAASLGEACRARIAELGASHPQAFALVANLASTEIMVARADGSLIDQERATSVLEVAAIRLAAELGAEHPWTLAAEASLASASGPDLAAGRSPALETGRGDFPAAGPGQHAGPAARTNPAGPGAPTGVSRHPGQRPSGWKRAYMRRVALADTGCATAGVITALALPFGYKIPYGYALLGLALPALWLIALSLVGAHNGRIIDDEAGEYRKVINAGVYLIATLAIVSLAVSHDRSRVYLLLAMPGITVLDLAARYLLRSRLLRQRAVGRCMSPVVAVGHESAVADLIAKLREDANRGMTVVTACLAETSGHREVAGVPVYGGLNDITSAVREYAADTVAVLSCPEIDDIMLWQLEWDLQETGADLCVAPTLLELPRLQAPVQAAAGLPLLRLQTPQLSGPRRVITGLFDRCVAAVALALLSPALAIVAAAIRLSDKGPVLVTQTRVGRGDRAFRLYKFRTMALDAEERQVDVAAVAATGGIALKTRRDPRVTPIGAHLERWSLDELPEFFNVLRGDMSLVGPRQPFPKEQVTTRSKHTGS